MNLEQAIEKIIAMENRVSLDRSDFEMFSPSATVLTSEAKTVKDAMASLQAEVTPELKATAKKGLIHLAIKPTYNLLMRETEQLLDLIHGFPQDGDWVWGVAVNPNQRADVSTTLVIE